MEGGRKNTVHEEKLDENEEQNKEIKESRTDRE